jgi:hypothetical protein
VLAVPGFFLGILLLYAWAKVVTDAYHADPQHINGTVLMTEFWILFGIMGAGAVFFDLACVLTLLGVAVSLCHFTVVFSRALLWRIVTHTKGAWNAVWILITGILGVLDLLVREKKI